MPVSNKMAETQKSQTATAVLLLLRSDQRFFFTSFPAGAALLESLPGFDEGAAVATTSFGAAKAASSKLVGRAATFTTGRPFSSLTFFGSAEGFRLGSVVTVVLDWIGSSSVNLVILDVLRPFFVGDSETAAGAARIPVGAASSSLEDSALLISAC